MPEKVKETTHLMGKYTGYELIDGVYHIAPMYVDNFEKLAVRRAGVDRLIRSVVRHVADINEEITSENKNLWDRIMDDIGLDNNTVYEYSANGTIKKKEEVTK